MSRLIFAQRVDHPEIVSIMQTQRVRDWLHVVTDAEARCKVRLQVVAVVTGMDASTIERMRDALFSYRVRSTLYRLTLAQQMRLIQGLNGIIITDPRPVLARKGAPHPLWEPVEPGQIFIPKKGGQ